MTNPFTNFKDLRRFIALFVPIFIFVFLILHLYNDHTLLYCAGSDDIPIPRNKGQEIWDNVTPNNVAASIGITATVATGIFAATKAPGRAVAIGGASGVGTMIAMAEAQKHQAAKDSARNPMNRPDSAAEVARQNQRVEEMAKNNEDLRKTVQELQDQVKDTNAKISELLNKSTDSTQNNSTINEAFPLKSTMENTDSFWTKVSDYFRTYYTDSFMEKIEIRDRYHEIGNIGQFEDLIARHNLEAMFAYFALVLLTIGVISLFIHAILWLNKSTIVKNFPLTLGLYVGSPIFTFVVVLNFIFITIDILTLHVALSFLYHEFIPIVVGVSADIHLGTTA